jgi:hypothetical protein
MTGWVTISVVWYEWPTMEIAEDKVDRAVLALLWLTLHDGNRAWKGHDWDAMRDDRIRKSVQRNVHPG